MNDIKWIGRTDTPRLEWGYNGEGYQKLHDDALKRITPEKRSILFRKELTVNGTLQSAVLSVCGLGFYHLRINGKKVGDYVLTPLETAYRKRVLYDEYDVTDMLIGGVNAVGVELGNGRYSSPKKYWGWRAAWYGDPCLALRLTLVYTDGRRETLETDRDWKCAYGPILKNCYYDGETYDANREQEGWSTAGFDDSGWQNALTVAAPCTSLQKNTYFHLKKHRTLKPSKVLKKLNGRTIYVFSENISGWVRIRVAGQKGEQLRIRYAEKSDAVKGYLDTYSNRNAENTDVYILKGAASEEYEPKFTLRGFSAVEITVEDCMADILEVEAYQVYADVEQDGYFTCDNEDINRLHDVILRTQKAALMSFPMDCPQRDERLGWLGDASVTAATCLYNFDMRRFYTKFLEDIRGCAHSETGAVSFLAPWHTCNHAVDFGTGYLVILWEHYLFYRDKELLAQHCDSVVKYVDHLGTLGPILDKTKYGDWMSRDKGWVRGDPPCSSSLCYYYALLLTVKILGALGREDQKQHYISVAEQEKAAILDRFYDAEGKSFGNNSQFSLSFALRLGLIPDQDKRAVLERLLADIKAHDYHLTTGIFGTKHMMEVLKDNGAYETAMRLILQDTFPSWLDLIRGKTTLSERWDGGGSQNHCMFGSIDSIFYSMTADIRIDEKIEILPAPCDRVRTVKAKVSLRGGQISVDRTPDKLIVDIDGVSDVFFKGTPLNSGHYEFNI
ncbi:MAG: family 78 glycoside hydrolase catalytic domain [Clostridia bacterium]|nr:family 78 glycoside hydrolase catalytic domain [Clostridia bacterium]